jgi:hypothetical protein
MNYRPDGARVWVDDDITVFTLRNDGIPLSA